MAAPRNRAIDDWSLLACIAGVETTVVLACLPTQDLSSALGVSEMIQLSVRLSVPFLYLAFAASSINVLAPSAFSRWLLRNRRSVGLGFAAGMAWQLFFILWMVTGHSDYFMEEVYWIPDLVFQVPAYLFLFAMTLTSFHPVRRRMGRQSWRLLHWVGIHFLWYTVVATYYDEITYYDDRQLIDYVYAAAGAGVLLLRVAAWARSVRHAGLLHSE